MKLQVFLIVTVLAGQPALAQPPKTNADDEAALLKNAEAFVAAFHKADAKAVAARWTTDGDYVDQTGKHFKGRAAIEKAFEGFFADHKGLKLRIDSDSLRIVTADVAIEDGTTSVISPDGSPPSRARYTIVHVKRDGQWLLSSVRDAPFAPPGNYENLRVLEWAIGDWAAENDKGEAEQLSLNWTDNQNFIVGSFTARVKGLSVGTATHWVGWDPRGKRIRSWIFDATGGFGEGAWTGDRDKWVIRTTSILQDGTNAAATISLGRVDADTLSLQSTDRSVDGEAVPDTKKVMLKRVR